MLIQNILQKVIKLIKTDEYYGGTYPQPHEVIDDDEYDDFGLDDDYDLYMADEYHELMMIGAMK